MYKIVRIFYSDDYDTETIKTGLTLAEAQAHCNDPETSSSTTTSNPYPERGSWFDDYNDETR